MVYSFIGVGYGVQLYRSGIWCTALKEWGMVYSFIGVGKVYSFIGVGYGVQLYRSGVWCTIGWSGDIFFYRPEQVN